MYMSRRRYAHGGLFVLFFLVLSGCAVAPQFSEDDWVEVVEPVVAEPGVAQVTELAGEERASSPDSRSDSGGSTDHDHSHSSSDRISLDLEFSKGWLDPYVHRHTNRRGTPYLHLFGAEPAFLGRDLILTAAFAEEEDGKEFELEAELEWAFTRRLGLVIEVPYRWLRPDATDEDDEDGFGDLAIAPRAVLVETDRFILSLNLELELPTGSEGRGLGGGEVALSPTLSWWYDVIGGRLAWSGQVGTEHALESGEDELVYTTGINLSLFRGHPGKGGHHEHHGHSYQGEGLKGLTSLILEFSGRTALSGEESGRSTGEGLVGLSFFATERLELRGGVKFPVMRPKELDVQYLLSLLWHF